ncbi:hypothetical protein LIT32_18010 [Bacillus sp. CMF21]|nr:hypothetical protein LIT32_18010 [Bacillus sp. CMF21]
MLKIDRSEIDKAIKEMNLFTATQEVLNAYEKEKAVLEKRGKDLNERIAELTERHATTLIDRESASDNTSDYIYLSKELASIDEEMRIILSLQEQLAGQFTALKQKHAPMIRETYSKDMAVKREFDVNSLVDYVRYELVKSIADYANAVREQDAKIMPLIYDEFLDDEQLMQENKSFKRTFDFDRHKLSYSEASKSVISRDNINWACGGNIAPEITKPKGEVK